MPHLDEGQLHALLDGAYAQEAPEALHIRAHLAECAHCRALLEQESALRERAAVILRAARPGSEEVPPFTEVLQRAHRTPSRSRPRAPARLAWAASIMLALGAGWISRGMFATMEREAEPSAPAASAGTSTADASADAPVFASPPPAPPPMPGQAGQAAVGNRALQRTEQLAESRVADAAEPQRAPPSSTTPPVAPRAELAQKVATVAPQSARRGDSVTPPPAAPPPPPLTEAVRTREAEQVPAGRVAGVAFGDVPLTWTYYTTREEAERIARRSVLLVPDLEVVSVAVASRGGSWLLRATQRLPDGSTIELVQEPILETSRDARRNFAEAAAARSQVLAEEASRVDETGASLLTLRLGEIRVTARATLPADSLRALVRRLQ